MILSGSKTFIRGSNIRSGVALFAFAYFLTLSMDLVHINFSMFQLKLGHIVAIVMGMLLMTFRKGIEMDKRFAACFLWIFVAAIISALFSPSSSRSVGYALIFVFTFATFFVTPIRLVQLCDANRLIGLYTGSFLVVGTYAALQFFGSMLGIELPFSTQKLIFVRGSALAHEPSFYALYAIPIVMFLNARSLFLSSIGEGGKGRWGLMCSNLFLLVSTSTTAIVAYLVFFLLMLVWKRTPSTQAYFQGVRKKLMKIACWGLLGFTLLGAVLFELFKATFFKFFFFGLVHESFRERFQGILSSLEVFVRYPLFGVGFGGVGPLLYKEEFFPHYALPFGAIDREALTYYDPTNLFAEMLSSVGLFGCCALLMLLWFIWKKFQVALSAPMLQPQERINLLSLLISIAVMLICLQINQGLFRAYVWTHLGLSVGYAMKVVQKAV